MKNRPLIPEWELQRVRQRALQRLAIRTHGYAYARSLKFYDTTVFWQWMRMPGDIVFAAGTLLMTWDFLAKLLGQRRARIGTASR